jgi:hypothetical protein
MVAFLFSGPNVLGDDQGTKSEKIAVWRISADHGNMKQLRSEWSEYFGIHYNTYKGPWMTVRGYGGPHVRAVEQRDSPARTGPFSSRIVKLSLSDIRRYGERGRGRPLSELIPEILDRGLKAIYPLNVHEMGDKDLCYWMIRLVYEQFPGKGPVTILKRGLQFIEWVNHSGMSADQTRLIWWGADASKPGGKGREAVRLLGEFFGDADLWVRSETRGKARVYLLATDENEDVARVMVAVIPSNSEAVSVAELIISLPSGTSEKKWSARAIQLSEDHPPVEEHPSLAVKANQLNLVIDREISEPFLVLLIGDI